MCQRHAFGKKMNTDKCTEIRPLNPNFRAVFYPNLNGLWINENARKTGISAKYKVVKRSDFRYSFIASRSVLQGRLRNRLYYLHR